MAVGNDHAMAIGVAEERLSRRISMADNVHSLGFSVADGRQSSRIAMADPNAHVLQNNVTDGWRSWRITMATVEEHALAVGAFEQRPRTGDTMAVDGSRLAHHVDSPNNGDASSSGYCPNRTIHASTVIPVEETPRSRKRPTRWA